MKKCAWISWETHRRSQALSQAFDCDYACFAYDKSPSLVRYLVSTWKTTAFLFGSRYRLVFAQNPSLVLSLLAVILRQVRGYTLIIDAHNIAIEQLQDLRFFTRQLTRFVTRRADFVIVSNDNLRTAVLRYGGRPLVLADTLPAIAEHKLPERFQNNAGPIVTCISSFASDEPIEEFIKGALTIDRPFRLYITGSRKKAKDLIRYEAEKIVFTDFLDAEEFDALIQNSALLVDLTTRRDCLVCGAYEAVSVGVPVLLSDSVVLKEMFPRGSVFSKNSKDAYAEALDSFFENQQQLVGEMRQMKGQFEKRWQEQFSNVRVQLELTRT